MSKNNKQKNISKKDNTKKAYSTSPIVIQSIFRGLALTFVIPFLLYLQTTNFKLSYFDDDLIIKNNVEFLSDFSNVSKAFQTGAFIGTSGMFYRPLQTISYMTDIQISGSSEYWMFHLTNIILFAIVSSLIFLLLLEFSIPYKLAIASSLVFSCHPLFVSTASWIPARGDIMLALFSILAIISFIKYLKNKENFYLILNWISFSIALFCKETAVLIPFILLIHFLLFSNEKLFAKRNILLASLYLFSGIIWLLLRQEAITETSSINAVFGLKAVLLNFPAIPESLSKFFIPFFKAPIPEFSLFKTFAGIIFILLIAFVLFRKKLFVKKEIIFSISWFLIFMFPPMLYKNMNIDYLDHRYFLPLIGLLMLIVFIFQSQLIENNKLKKSWIITLVIISLFAFSFVKSKSYKEPITYYNAAIKYNSNSALAYINRGKFKDNNSDYEGAINDFDKAIELKPNEAIAYNNRGFSKNKLKKNKEAIKDYDKAIGLNKNYADAYYNRGMAYIGLGNIQKAIESYDKAIEIRPKFAEAFNSKGVAFGYEQKYDSAIKYFNKSIDLKPKYIDAYLNRALAKLYFKDFNGAIEDCNFIIDTNPENTRAISIKSNAARMLSDSIK